MVNKVQGKGFEDERNYTNMRFHFFDIDNIHVMRASLQKLVDSKSSFKLLTICQWHHTRTFILMLIIFL